jgi:hypothetical protein
VLRLAPLHAKYVRDLIFDILDADDLAPLRVGLQKIADGITPVSGRSHVPDPRPSEAPRP